MEDFLCELCETHTSNFLILSCGHNLCYECVENILNSLRLKFKEDRQLRCPFCFAITILSSSSLQGFTQNSILQIIAQDSSIIKSFKNGLEKQFYALSLEEGGEDEKESGGESAKDLNEAVECEEHNLIVDFFCEETRKAMCRVCAEEYFFMNYEVIHKDDIEFKYYSTILDLKHNKTELLNISSLFLTNSDRFKSIIEYSPKTWIESLNQILDIKSLTELTDSDVQSFFDKTSPLTRLAIEKLTSLPPRPSDYTLIGYVTRGSHDLYTYDFTNNNYNHLKINRLVSKWSCILQIHDGIFFVTGGKPSKDQGAISKCFTINMRNGLTTDNFDMLSAHSSHVSLMHNNRIYVISGKDATNQVSTFVEYWDMKLNTWNRLANCIIGRTCASGAVYNDFIYVIGGCKNNTIESYDIHTDVWNLFNFNMPDIKWQHSAVAIDNGILIFGGEGINDEPSRNSYIFNLRNYNFIEFQELPVGNSWLSSWYPVLFRGNRIWVMNKELKFLSYNTITHQWSTFKKPKECGNNNMDTGVD
ncbi:hypothetical protein SteCoe_27351 [Stentor coeruleus]|uniref:RING-type domain-containing protein n=1 Tax=Stentor coeruleus TaxID=5963 RepID=A0A1R2BAS1_9CILI|nr:hypothetical protein SteCoe_27351 [Stentor coeruleus]